MSLETLRRRYTERGAYSIVGKTGTMAAGLAAASPIFSFRWATGTANAKALIDRINVSLASLATGFAAGVGYIDAVVARAFSAQDYGGVAAPAMTSTIAAGTGGTLATATYFYVVTALGAWGESAASSESSAAVTGPTGSVTVTYGSTAGATGYRIYRGTATGVYDGYYDDAASTFVDTGAAFSATGVVPGSSPPVGGLILTTNNAKRRTGMATTLLSQALLSTTASLTAGTRALDSQAFGAVQFPVSTATNAVHLSSRDGDIWRADQSTLPLILAASEGIVIRATVPATGTWQGVVTVDWREVL